MNPEAASPKILVFTSLFPSTAQPQAGIFIRERMFRVAKELPLLVVAPMPWFPLQSVIRLFRPHFRPPAPRHEVQQGIDIYRPRFFSMPGLFKHWDGLFMALGCHLLLARLKRTTGFDIIDAHFAYPDGFAASLLGKWLKVPVTITLRGTEVSLAKYPGRRARIIRALARAKRVFAVSESLKQFVVALGADRSKILVVGNGIDSQKFSPMQKDTARLALGLAPDIPILITVGGLVERKGFHRVIAVLPALCSRFPGLRYLIVGGASAEGDWRPQLERQVSQLGLRDVVSFLGTLQPEQLRIALSAADVFVLATRNEGWANVLLEALACGLPVVTTDVGGNREVVCHEGLGFVIPFGDPAALQDALATSLRKQWDHEAIVAYARDNDWSGRVATLVQEFREIQHCSEKVSHG